MSAQVTGLRNIEARELLIPTCVVQIPHRVQKIVDGMMAGSFAIRQSKNDINAAIGEAWREVRDHDDGCSACPAILAKLIAELPPDKRGTGSSGE